MEFESDELLQLKWDNYGNSIIDSFKKFRGEETFCDVTLWTEKESLKCHKVILSASSGWFERMLSRSQETSCSSIYLHGISSNTIRNLVTFMYESELTISQEDLSELLEVASVLEVKGLSQIGNEGNFASVEEKGQVATDINRNSTNLLSTGFNLGCYQEEGEHANESLNVQMPNERVNCNRCGGSFKHKESLKTHKKYRCLGGESASDNPKDVEELYSTESERRTVQGHPTQGQREMTMTQYKCLLCAYSTPTRNMVRRHISDVHKKNERVTCDLCGGSFKNIHSLKSHQYKCRKKHGNLFSQSSVSLLKPVSEEEAIRDGEQRGASISNTDPKPIKMENIRRACDTKDSGQIVYDNDPLSLLM